MYKHIAWNTINNTNDPVGFLEGSRSLNIALTNEPVDCSWPLNIANEINEPIDLEGSRSLNIALETN